MIVNKTNMGAVFLNIRTEFNKALATTPVQWDKTAMKVQSNTAENQYKWLSMFPSMQEWAGDKAIRQLKAFTYSIFNKKWEATIVLDKFDLMNDNMGLIAPQARQTGISAAEWPDTMLATLKNGAFTTPCFDNQYFYDTDHPVGTRTVTTMSNKGTAALSNASFAAITGSLGLARIYFLNMYNDEGQKTPIMGPYILEVPPALEAMAQNIYTNDKLADDSPNPYKNMFQPLINPRLTSSTQWMVHAQSMALKPFIFQENMKPTFVKQDSFENDDFFMRANIKYGLEAYGNAGYGLWQLSYGSTGAA